MESSEEKSRVPPKGFSFKMGNRISKSYSRPLLKLKRMLSEFDGLPLNREEPYAGFQMVDNFKQPEQKEEEVPSPAERKRKLLEKEAT